MAIEECINTKKLYILVLIESDNFIIIKMSLKYFLKIFIIFFQQLEGVTLFLNKRDIFGLDPLHKSVSYIFTIIFIYIDITYINMIS